ncbi:MAG: C4-dicarboxylate ABC transporter permease [Xanthomonadales bacterium]|nr:C4-dicarboxylate ABC transporter permease [Xanthomonadales bacterium]
MNEGSQASRRSPVLVVLEAVDRVLGWAERVIVAGSVLAMALLMAAHVVGNLVFGSGIPGTYEITELLIVVMTFVGVGYATRCARHISMSAIYDTLSGTPRKALLIVISLGTGALMFYFAYKSAQYDLDIFDRGRVSSSVGIPLWMVYLALPIGFSLAGLQYLLTIVRNLASPGTWRSFHEREGYADVPDSGDAADGGLS